MKRLRVMLSDSAKSIVKAKDKLRKACRRAAESSEQLSSFVDVSGCSSFGLQASPFLPPAIEYGRKSLHTGSVHHT